MHRAPSTGMGGPSPVGTVRASCWPAVAAREESPALEYEPEPGWRARRGRGPQRCEGRGQEHGGDMQHEWARRSTAHSCKDSGGKSARIAARQRMRLAGECKCAGSRGLPAARSSAQARDALANREPVLPNSRRDGATRRSLWERVCCSRLEAFGVGARSEDVVRNGARLSGSPGAPGGRMRDLEAKTSVHGA